MKNTVDYNELLELLAEYSTKLRNICEYAEKSKMRFLITTATFLAIFMVIFSLIITFFIYSPVEESFLTKSPVSSLLFIYALFPILYVWFFQYKSNYRRIGREAHTLAASIQRLTKLLSQHVDFDSDLNNKIIFELRLSEAVSTLEIYNVVFKVEQK